jgi:hypothetical protein
MHKEKWRFSESVSRQLAAGSAAIVSFSLIGLPLPASDHRRQSFPCDPSQSCDGGNTELFAVRPSSLQPPSAPTDGELLVRIWRTSVFDSLPRVPQAENADKWANVRHLRVAHSLRATVQPCYRYFRQRCFVFVHTPPAERRGCQMRSPCCDAAFSPDGACPPPPRDRPQAVRRRNRTEWRRFPGARRAETGRRQNINLTLIATDYSLMLIFVICFRPVRDRRRTLH